MERKLREELLSAARANGAKHGKAAELDFGAGAEWMYEKLKSHNSDYMICEECGSSNIELNKVCNECYAEVTITHII